ncbi:MAG: serine protease [Candidatus Zixiibacteriota bacterium]
MLTKRNLFKSISIISSLSVLIFCFSTAPCLGGEEKSDVYGQWMKKPQSEWPQITMINQIDYTDKNHPIAGCGFLLDTGDEILAATAKHILIYFKSESMKAVDFNNTLKLWKMFPKDNPNDVVILDKLINANPDELLGQQVPPAKDWLLFDIKEKSNSIQPLKFRTGAMQEGEPVYIIGWRYTDKDCPQVIYEGNFVRAEDGSVLLTTKELSDNTMPGLSGSPVVDSKGFLIGLMSQKAGKMERLSSIDYPKEILGERAEER